MPHLEDAAPLPTATSLPRRAQLRLVAIAVLILIGVFAVISVLYHLSRPTQAPEAPSPAGSFRPTAEQLAHLQIQPVATGSDPLTVNATGTISVDEDHSTPVVLPYSGQVGDVLVQAGQRVTRGQALLKIASPDFVEARNTLFSAAAARATAIAQLKIAQENEKRQAAIYQSAGGALKDFRQAENDLVGAQSNERSADAALGAARDKLSLLGKSPDEVQRLEAAGEVAGIYSQTTYHAPVSGTIASRDVAPGQYVSAGGDKPVLVIADLTRVWLVAQVSEGDAAAVHLGDPVDVTTPAYPGRIFHAVIDNIGASLDPQTHRLPVRATVANPDEALKPEMFASFSIRRTHETSATLVPASAVIHEGDSARVWVIDRNGLLTARPVVVSDSAKGEVSISAGLHPGERIVTSGAIFVNEAGLGE
jgi:cobalt-zinc-cadmium efflux system membrane fusion protein